MSDQYSIFDAPAASAAAPQPPERGVKFYKLTLTDGESFFIRTPLSMLALSGELRARTRATLLTPDGQQIECYGDKVRYIERVHRYVLEQARSARLPRSARP